jgi:hypothetical protein
MLVYLPSLASCRSCSLVRCLRYPYRVGLLGHRRGRRSGPLGHRRGRRSGTLGHRRGRRAGPLGHRRGRSHLHCRNLLKTQKHLSGISKTTAFRSQLTNLTFGLPPQNQAIISYHHLVESTAAWICKSNYFPIFINQYLYILTDKPNCRLRQSSTYIQAMTNKSKMYTRFQRDQHASWKIKNE